MSKEVGNLNEYLRDQLMSYNGNKINAFKTLLPFGRKSLRLAVNGYDVKFLIEYDSSDPYEDRYLFRYGIYYGVQLYLKNEIKDGEEKIKDEINELEKIWLPIRRRLTEILGLPLRRSDIIGENKDKTKIIYWPFYISLGEEQNLFVAEANLEKIYNSMCDMLNDVSTFEINVR